MVQSPFSALTGFFNKKSNLLKTRVVIYAYNHHVRLLSPESLVVRQPSLLGSRSRHCYAIMLVTSTDFWRVEYFSSLRRKGANPRSASSACHPCRKIWARSRVPTLGSG